MKHTTAPRLEFALEHFKLNYSRFYFGKDHAGNFTEENEGNEERLVFPDSKLRFLRYLL
jgi:hypothetical protein